MSGPGHFATAEPAARRQRRSWKQRILLTFGAGVVLTGLLGAAFVGFVLAKLNSIERLSDLDIDAAPPGEPRNFLLVGSDSRDEAAEEHGNVSGQRSDTIMIARIDPGEEQAAVLSLPRDLVVPIADTGEAARINSAYAKGTPEEGRQNLINTIRQNFGIDINHFVEVKFDGFARLVDAVGGVPLFFETPVRDWNFETQSLQSGFIVDRSGCTTLHGEQALAFVRSRSFQQLTPSGWETDGTGDLGRITRQHIFMREAVTRMVSAAKSNPLKVTQLIDIGVDAVALDDQLGLSDIRDLADRFSDFSEEKLQTFSLPIVERGDGATVAVDTRAAEPILNIFRGLDPGEISPGLIPVRVLNGTGENGQANDVAGALEVIGFDVMEATDAEPHERTTIYHAAGDKDLAVRVLRHVTGGAELVESPDVVPGEVRFVTGNDFTTVHDQPAPVDEVTTTTTAPGGGGDTSGSSVDEQTTTTGASTTTTTAPTTTTTVIGDAVGAVPEGADCSS